MTEEITFQQLESSSNCDNFIVGNSPLDEWYQSIRGLPINKLNDGDLCRACRQKLYPIHVVPIAVARLHLQPLAGDIYDGELLVAMKAIPVEYWQGDLESATCLRKVAQKVIQVSDDSEVIDDVKELVRRIAT